jgi:hypothetical protein
MASRSTYTPKTEDGQSEITNSTVTLTPSYTHVVSGNVHSLHDAALCRVFAWSDKPFMSNTSCFVGPALGLLKVEGVQAKTLDPYWAESAIGLQSTPADRLTVRRRGSETDYRLKDTVVVRLIGVAAKLSPAESMEMTRYYSRNVHLHPQVRRDLEKTSSLPARLEIDTRLPSKDHEILTISNVRRGKVSFPLPPGLTSVLRADTLFNDPVVQRGIEQSLLAIDGQSAIRKPTGKELFDGMQKAAEQGRQGELALLYMNLAEQYPTWINTAEGRPHVEDIAVLQDMVAASKDISAATLWRGSEYVRYPNGPGNREDMALLLTDLAALDPLPFNTYRYVLFANLARTSSLSMKWNPGIFNLMPRPLVNNFWTHIAAYPWASSAYSEAADVYMADGDPFAAWLAYDLGRAVDKDWRDGEMAKATAIEQEIRSSQPDFF